MNIIEINWDYESEPKCKNGDLVILVQYGEAEIAKYISPAPKGAPTEGSNFIFEMCDNEDDLEEKAFDIIRQKYPKVTKQHNMPFLFLCPIEFSKNAIWGKQDI